MHERNRVSAATPAHGLDRGRMILGELESAMAGDGTLLPTAYFNQLRRRCSLMECFKVEGLAPLPVTELMKPRGQSGMALPRAGSSTWRSRNRPVS